MEVIPWPETGVPVSFTPDPLDPSVSLSLYQCCLKTISDNVTHCPYWKTLMNPSPFQVDPFLIRMADPFLTLTAEPSFTHGRPLFSHSQQNLPSHSQQNPPSHSQHIDEHKRFSFSTGWLVNRPMNSSVRQHSEEHGQKFLFSDFKILNSTTLDLDLCILVILWI